jgi:hypothetical protein
LIGAALQWPHCRADLCHYFPVGLVVMVAQAGIYGVLQPAQQGVDTGLRRHDDGGGRHDDGRLA